MSNPSPPSASPTGPRSPQFECELSSGRASAWIRAAGELDLSSAAQFELAVKEALSSVLLVIIDLRELTFIDSTGLHLIIDADAQAGRTGRRLLLVRGPAHIDRLFALVGLSDRLKIVDLPPALVSAPVLSTGAQSVPGDDRHFAQLEQRREAEA